MLPILRVILSILASPLEPHLTGSFVVNQNLSQLLQQKKMMIKSELVFYEDLLHNLNNNNLLLQTASLSKEKLDISISTSQHRNAIRSSSYAGSIASKSI